MFDWIKDKITETTLTLAVGLAALQIILPSMIDLVLDAAIIGLMFVASKTK